ncbi:MAG TPA: type I secretion C-terminal target domain-containing protein [Coleofasciculaceae cyanobacterium]|jgi:Ca2+-binding RTX toxin-like protein
MLRDLRENKILTGGRFNDALSGNKGNDVLTGGAGSDALVGSAGNDTLTGGAGPDFFTFNSTTEGTDSISDFTIAEDVIDLRAIFAQTAFQNIAVTANERLNQFVQVVQVGADTQIKIDADGIGSGNTFATLAILKNIGADIITAANFAIA